MKIRSLLVFFALVLKCIALRAGTPGPLVPASAASPSTAAPALGPAEQEALGKAFQARLCRLYGKEVIFPLLRYDLPGGRAGFAAAVARARAAGVPENFLAEVTSQHAVFDFDQAGVRAVMPALRRARAEWTPETSMFYSPVLADVWINALATTLSMESMEAGAFVKMARPFRKKSLAETIRWEQQLINGSVLQITIEENLREGTVVPEARWLTMVSPALKQREGRDVLGRAYGPQRVGTWPMPHPESVRELSPEVPELSWAEPPQPTPAAAPSPRRPVAGPLPVPRQGPLGLGESRP